MPRSREELVEALRDWANQYQSLDQLPSLVSVLGEAADLLDSLEEREEFRVVASGSRQGFDATRPMTFLLASAHAEELRKTYEGDVRIQSRTVCSTPWTDVEEGTDGR
jgi:hypothetical protein